MSKRGRDILGVFKSATGAVAAAHPVVKAVTSAAAPAPAKPSFITQQAAASSIPSLQTPSFATTQPVAASIPALQEKHFVTQQAKNANLPQQITSGKATPPDPNIQKNMQSGNRAISVGKKIGHLLPRTGNKLVALGGKVVGRAQAAQKQAAAAAAPAAASPMKAAIKGVILGLGEFLLQSTKVLSESYAVDAVADAGEIVYEMYPLIQQAQAIGQAAFAGQGQSIADQLSAAVDSLDIDNVDTSLYDYVNSIKPSATQWMGQAQGLVASGAQAAMQQQAMPFDPGTSSGDTGSYDSGSGSSYGDTNDDFDTGESQAVQEFRDEGVDPFDDDGGGDDGGDFASAKEMLDSGDSVTDDGVDDWGDAGGEVSDNEIDNYSSAKEMLDSSDIDHALDRTNVDDMMGFEWQISDIFMPWQAAQRQMQEATPDAIPYNPTGTPAASTMRANPALAAKLAAAKQKQAAMRQTAAAARAQQSASLAAAMAAQQTQSDNSDGEVTVMGMDDLADLVIGALADIAIHGEVEITDEPPDYERAHGSVHRGAAYLQPIDYPPWGASSGQEGGTMRPKNEIEIFGHTYARGLDIVGVVPLAAAAKKLAAAPRAAFVARQSPITKRKITSLVPNPHGKKLTHQQSINNAKDVAKRAVSSAKKLAATAAKVAATPKPVAKPAVAVHGLVPRAAVHHVVAHNPQQLKTMAVKLSKAAGDLSDKANKHGQLIQTVNAKQKAAIAAFHNKYGGAHPKGTNIAGDDFACEVLGAMIEDLENDIILGTAIDHDIEVLGDDLAILGMTTITQMQPAGGAASNQILVDPMTGAPSYGDPLPGYPGADPSSDMSTDSGVDMSAANNYGCGPMPTMQSIGDPDHVPDPNPTGDETVYNSVTDGGLPLGAILYDPTIKPLPWQGVGSRTRFTHDANMDTKQASGHDGGYANSGFQLGGGSPNQFDGWYWWWEGATSGTQYKRDEPEAGNLMDGWTPPPHTVADRAAQSRKLGWGPLIGNPAAWTKGLRFDEGAGGPDGAFFWFWDQAPQWAKAGGPNGDNARLAQAIVDWRACVTAAQTDAANQALQDVLDQQSAAALAKQTAAEDLQMQHDQQQEEQQAAHEAQIQSVADQQSFAQQQQQSQLQDESMARQMQAQAQYDAQMAEAQSRIDQQEMETAARLDAMAPPGDGGPYNDGSGEYGDGGYVDDGSDMDNSSAAMDADTDAEMSMDDDMLGAISAAQSIQDLNEIILQNQQAHMDQQNAFSANESQKIAALNALIVLEQIVKNQQITDTEAQKIQALAQTIMQGRAHVIRAPLRPKSLLHGYDDDMLGASDIDIFGHMLLEDEVDVDVLGHRRDDGSLRGASRLKARVSERRD